jgi:general secretion pathway protein G
MKTTYQHSCVFTGLSAYRLNSPPAPPLAAMGFTLIEVLVTLVIIGMMGAVAGTVISETYTNEASYEDTVVIMAEIKKAILGDNTPLNRGVHLSGYVADMGRLPSLNEFSQPESLWQQTQGISKSWYYEQARIRTGWNGPYVSPPENGILTDGWGSAIVFEGAQGSGSMTMTSYGADQKQGGTGIDQDISITIGKHHYMAPLGLRFKGLSEDIAKSNFHINLPGNGDGTLYTQKLTLDSLGRFVSNENQLFPIGLRSITARIWHGNQEETRVLVFPIQPGMNYLGTIE